jgi:hypothetical protein
MEKKLTKTYVLTRTKKNPSKTSYPAKSHPITYKIPSQDVIIHNGIQRTIRYCENDPSVFLDEQYEHSVKTSIVVENGYLIVPPEKDNLQRYLDLTNFNEACENRMPGRSILFREVNTKKIIQDNIDKSKRSAKAYAIVTELSDAHVLALSRALGISVTELESPADNFAASKMNLFKYAGEHPKRIVDMSTDEAEMLRIERISDLMDAHAIDVIRVDNNAWKFPEGGKILAIPMGADKYAVLSDFTFDTPEGRDTFREINRRIGKKVMDEKTYEEKFETNLTEEQKETINKWTDKELLEKAKAAGVIYYASPNHHFIEKEGDTKELHIKLSQKGTDVIEQFSEDSRFKMKVQARTINAL